MAPEFAGTTTNGEHVRLSLFRGKRVVLYFYPRDNTPGCTKEACNFRDAYEKITAKDVVLLGVSTDSVAAHVKFTKKYQLPFPLIADENKQIVEAYGVWDKKSFLGRTFLGIVRSTFLIGADGRIQKIWRKVKVGPHVDEVLSALG